MDEPKEDVAAEPRCPRHRDVVAYVRCQRCGRPTCPECQRVAAVGIHCVDCVKEARAAVRPVVSTLGLPVAHGMPRVTLALIVVNVAVFIIGPAVLGEFWREDLAIAPVVAGSEPWRWVTAGFVHVGIVHLGFNMIALYQFGGLVERLLGRGRFVVLYFVSLLGSSALVVLLGEHRTPHVGASGAVYGVLAAYIIIGQRLRIPIREVLALGGLWFALGFVIPGLSWEGHLGGAIAGALVTLLLLARKRGPRPGAPLR